MAHLVTGAVSDTANLSWIEAIWQHPILRAFWIYDVPPGQTRGGHRHNSSQMVLQCVVGSVSIYVQTPDGDEHFVLDSMHNYLFLAARDWRLMYEFSPDALLMIITDRTYEETTYIDKPYRIIAVN